MTESLEHPLTIIDPDGQLGSLGVSMVTRSPRSDGTVSLLGKGEEEAEPTPEPKGGDNRVSFAKDPETGEIVFSNGTRFKANKSTPETEVAKASFSFARQRMEARRKAKADANFKQIEAVTIEGEDWFIKRLSGAETMALPFYIARRDGGEIDLADLDPSANEDDRFALYVAIIYGVTVSGEDDLTPAFATVDEVWQQFDEPGDDEFILQLIAQIFRINKNLLKNLTGG